jgi:ATP-dependent RNA helicase RhlB
MSEHHLTETRFDEFEIDTRIIRGLNDSGFEFCTPIQANSLPVTLSGRDVAGEAQTGTGKTAAFLVACFDYLLKNPANEERKANHPRALILAPTRELAIQIHKDALCIGKHTGLTFGLAYGGTGYESQRKQLEDGVDILIGTPGRIIDYFKQHVFNLKDCQVVVLDEADRMFDLGFIKDIRYLLRRCPDPEKRLSLLFSATLSHRIGELAYEHMNKPEEIRIEADTKTADKVKQTVYYPANEEKIPLLLGLIKSLKSERSIVFINTKRVAENVDAWLEGNGIKSALLSGDVPQKKRQTLLKKFQDNEFSVLVATDVAARGLHIPDVSHVFNFDLPQSGEDYVHRVGRTARAGASGAAISFACEDYAHYLMDIEEYIGHRINNEPVAPELLATLKPRAKREKRPARPKYNDRSKGHSSARSHGNTSRPRHKASQRHK